jgi:uncharacterized RDD family membrane protein YckC
VEYEDRISVVTPEGITLELTLAGVGSRFTALLLDWAVRIALLVAMVIVTGVWGDDAPGPTAVGAVLWTFLVVFAYDVLFETLASGRTPGKRWTGLRVVMAGGGPVGFLASTIRNLLRIIDFLPVWYGVGIVAVLASRRNQRLGDMAAGTLVVRERRVVAPAPAVREAPAADTSHWDVSAVTMDEVATVRRFLDRRPQLTPEARARLAAELARRLRPKVVGPSEEAGDEEFLEAVTAAKSARV